MQSPSDVPALLAKQINLIPAASALFAQHNFDHPLAAGHWKTAQEAYKQYGRGLLGFSTKSILAASACS